MRARRRRACKGSQRLPGGLEQGDGPAAAGRQAAGGVDAGSQGGGSRRPEGQQQGARTTKLVLPAVPGSGAPSSCCQPAGGASPSGRLTGVTWLSDSRVLGRLARVTLMAGKDSTSRAGACRGAADDAKALGARWVGGWRGGGRGGHTLLVAWRFRHTGAQLGARRARESGPPTVQPATTLSEGTSCLSSAHTRPYSRTKAELTNTSASWGSLTLGEELSAPATACSSASWKVSASLACVDQEKSAAVARVGACRALLAAASARSEPLCWSRSARSWAVVQRAAASWRAVLASAVSVRAHFNATHAPRLKVTPSVSQCRLERVWRPPTAAFNVQLGRGRGSAARHHLAGAT